MRENSVIKANHLSENPMRRGSQHNTHSPTHSSTYPLKEPGLLRMEEAEDMKGKYRNENGSPFKEPRRRKYLCITPTHHHAFTQLPTERTMTLENGGGRKNGGKAQ